MGSGATLHNQSTGTFEAQNDSTIVSLGGDVPSIINDGVFTKTAGSGTTSTGPASFHNNGSVNVLSGTLNLRSSGTSTGTFHVEAGTNIEFGGGIHTLEPSSAVTGSGTLKFNSGTVHVGGTYNITGATLVNGATANFNPGSQVLAVGSSLTISSGTANFNSGSAIHSSTLNLSSGTLSGTDTITVSGLTTWTGGTMTGTGITNANGGLTLGSGGSGTMDLTERTLNNAALTVWSGTGSFRMGSAATFHNQSTGTFDVQNDRPLSASAVLRLPSSTTVSSRKRLATALQVRDRQNSLITEHSMFRPAR
jgi:hypothetical protein